MRDASHHHRFIGSLCSCGAHAPAQPTVEEAVSESVQQALLHGLFPQPVLRRELLRTVGAGVIIGGSNCFASSVVKARECLDCRSIARDDRLSLDPLSHRILRPAPPPDDASLHRSELALCGQRYMDLD